ncbi:acetyltransferase [Vibrio sonorensis]|uniref:acetyltransferase n=1 Tax=Vibrio sonorensis TaxID=1004316 RepID=UPI0008D9241C|nr:acetyltransferase [Vibrio sonorensis]
MHFDIFNGDADGIISLIQLRLKEPKVSTLVTGVKRDIKLIEKIAPTQGDTITVLDISMAKNQSALSVLLSKEHQIFYADHHQSGEVPNSPYLNAHIDLSANTCTALIVDELLSGQFHHWAITAAYGDNLIATADALAHKAGLDTPQKLKLQELGTLINYNGYGETLADLHFHPADLYKKLAQYTSPFDVIEDSDSPYYTLKTAFANDMLVAEQACQLHNSEILKVVALDDGAASRRVSGVYGNQLANENPTKAHLILTKTADGDYRVSLRAPLENKKGAGYICSQFETGGGREAAAGINKLPTADLTHLIETIEAYY